MATGRDGGDNRWVIAAFTLIRLPDAFLPAWRQGEGFWTIADAVSWLGVVVSAAGGTLRVWPAFEPSEALRSKIAG
jgi:hypothetical protein